jgi:tetratricopeptide (TPR) repeat protein
MPSPKLEKTPTANKRSGESRPEMAPAGDSRLAQLKPGRHIGRRDWLIAAALAATTAIAFAPALRCGFVNFDDPYYVTGNTNVMRGPGWAATVWAFTTFEQANWHPLTWLSLQLDARLWGDTALGYHLTNVLLHAASAGLLFLALRALTGAAGRSLAVALLFAVHPLRAESVAWVAERKDVLSIFFGILALWGYAWYASVPSARRYLAVAVPFTLSLLCKPTLVTLPALLLVLDWWPLGRWRPKGAFTLVREKLPLFALTAASCVMSVLSQASRGAVLDQEMIPLSVRLGNAALAYVAYLAKTAWPLHLAPLYPHPALVPPGVSFPEVLAATVVLVAITVAAWALRRKAPYLLAGWLWYVGTLVPMLGLVQVGGQSYADRYTYFPQIGVLVAICWGAADLLLRRPRLAVAVTAVTAALLAGLNWQQVAIWHDSVTLWEHDLNATGPNHIALFNCGEGYEKQGRLQDAATRFRESLVYNPTAAKAYFELGVVLQKLGRPDEAVQQFQEVCHLDAKRADAHNRLGDLLFRQHKPDEAISHYESSLKIDPNDGRTLCNLAMVELATNHFDRAEVHYRQALQELPDSPEAHNGLGLILLKQGKSDEGIRELQRVIEVGTHPGHAHNNLGKAFEDLGKFDPAIEHYEQATRLSPELGIGWHNLGRMRLRQGRVPDAIACFEKAIELEPRSVEFRDALRQARERQAAPGRAEQTP